MQLQQAYVAVSLDDRNMADKRHRQKAICDYFSQGCATRNIQRMLRFEHGIVISQRQIKRDLQALNLHRKQYSSPNLIVDFIQNELKCSGQLNGYRIMYAKCITNGLKVRMEDVRSILQLLDPVGVALRQSRRLLRRTYHASGPNFIWHVDGNDKLKPYGLCIHGGICGYSRKILWLNCYNTNNNPRIIGGYFLEAVQECGGFPVVVRGDYGTENTYIRDFQCFLRRNNTAPIQPYIDGASTANQRIECWWGFLRKACTHFWIEHFRSLKENGDFGGDMLDKGLVQFCFMAILQVELDKLVDVWNNHTIRPSRNSTSPSGKPEHMYTMPNLWGAEDKLCPIQDWRDVDDCLEEAQLRSTVPCDPHLYQRCVDFLRGANQEPPSTISEATGLYLYLRHNLQQR